MHKHKGLAGFVRGVVLIGALLAMPLAAHGSAPAAPAAAGPLRPAGPGPTFTVNSRLDEPDSDAGDGVCRNVSSISRCTLGAAIMEANHVPGGGATIIVPAGVYELTIPPGDTNDMATGDLDLTASMTIRGAGAGSTIVDGGRLDGVFSSQDRISAISKT